MSACLLEPETATDPGILADNFMRVKMLQGALSGADGDLKVIPGLVRGVIAEGCWREWTDSRGQHFRWGPADFRRFLEDPRPRGCATPIHVVEKVLRGTDVWEEFQALVRGTPGGARPDQPRTDDGTFMGRNRDNITVAEGDPPAVIPMGKPKRDYSREAPTGTSVSYALRVLGEKRPDLFEQVKAGKLSAHRAMVVGGFRLPKVTIALDPPRAAAALRRHFTPEALAELVSLLATPEDPS
jgi:hypothetical protein